MRHRPTAKRWTRYWALPRTQRSLLLEAVLALVAARGALMLLPFRTLAAQLGISTAPEERSVLPATPLPRDQQLTVQAIAWAVTRAARHVPFRAVCLPQAIAAKAMLRRRGIASVLHFGVAKPEGGALEAHAWLDAAGIEVTGFPVGREFTEIACFV